ncbi:MAG: AAA family ATPase [Minicystis sp.]
MTSSSREVALKILHELSAEALRALKHEFRVLADVVHPNLVLLLDLVVDEAHRFFTMELVHGVDVLTHVGAGPLDRIRLGRVVSTFMQFASALDALHAGGRLHRDLKPSNALVEQPSGRVVIVDFGLALSDGRRLPGGARIFGGTTSYAAPEQVWSAEIGPAADWFAFGVLLYVALTGCRPFDGTNWHNFISGFGTAPKPPGKRVADVPPALSALVMGLLAYEPGARPKASAVQEMLTRIAADLALPRLPLVRAAGSDPRFVGRQREIAALDGALGDAAAGSFVVLCVEGPSGIGKTALVERALDGMVARGARVLRGRCHPNESVPFRAVDAIVDAIAYEGPASLDGRDTAMLGRIFPALGWNTTDAGDALESSVAPEAVRLRAFEALRTRIATLVTRGPLVLWIDDFQWADLDSLALLRALWRPPSPPALLLVLCFRDDDCGRSPALDAFLKLAATDDEMPTVRSLRVGPLVESDSRALAASVLETETDAGAVALAGRGSPFAIVEIGRRVRAGPEAAPEHALDAIVAERLDAEGHDARRLVEVIAIAGYPVEDAAAFAIAGAGAVDRALLARLRAARLLRTAPRAGVPALSTYHDRVRDLVLARLSRETVQDAHRRFAEWLTARPDADPWDLIEHLQRAGEPSRAASLAADEADRAMASLAFHKAASLYRVALAEPPASRSRAALAEQLGMALEAAGQAAQAARAYEEAVASLTPEARADAHGLDLIRRAAEQWLRGGRYDEGVATLRNALAAAALPWDRTTLGAIAAAVLNRAVVSVTVPRTPHQSPNDRWIRAQLDVAWSAGLGLSLFDAPRAFAYQARHARLAEAAGDVSHRARATATAALIAAWEGKRRGVLRSRDLEASSALLVRASRDARLRAHALVMGAGCAWLRRELVRALDLAREGIAFCRESCVGAEWERTNLVWLEGNALAELGQLGELRRRVVAELSLARERDDLYAQILAQTGRLGLAWLAEGHVARCREHAEAGRAAARGTAFLDWLAVSALAHADLFEGRPGDAFERISERRGAWSRAMLFRLQALRVEVHELWARAAVGAALEVGATTRAGARFLAQARRASQDLAREDAAWIMPHAVLVKALVAVAENSSANALAARSVEGFATLGMASHADAVRLILMGDAAARESLAARGAQYPERFAAALTAGRLPLDSDRSSLPHFNRYSRR